MEKEKQTPNQPKPEKIVNLCEDMNSHSHNEKDFELAMEHQKKMQEKLKNDMEG